MPGMTEATRRWQEANRERYLAGIKEWRRNNRERVNAVARSAYQRAKEADPEGFREKQRRYRDQRREEINAWRRAYWAANREQINARNRQRRRENGVLPKQRLTDDHVRAIRRFVTEGGRRIDAATIWQVSPSYITLLMSGKRRATVQDDPIAAAA